MASTLNIRRLYSHSSRPCGPWCMRLVSATTPGWQARHSTEGSRRCSSRMKRRMASFDWPYCFQSWKSGQRLVQLCGSTPQAYEFPAATEVRPMTLLPEVLRRTGSRSPVSRKCPRKLTPTISSKPSSVLRKPSAPRNVRATPALRTSTSRRENLARKASAKEWMDRTEARSRVRTTSTRAEAPAGRDMAFFAAAPRSGERHASTTVAPASARALAVRMPMAPAAPVTSTTLPSPQPGGVRGHRSRAEAPRAEAQPPQKRET
mmetsp:Transcript_66763/g.206714  ORF Transcript_66763/g.206714 Transcript_66763/m.206714 type:complete len:262 (+) Transcript_66763:285-1070(+)